MDNNLTLAQVDKGLAVDQINDYIAKIIADIADPTKIAEKNRTLTFTMKFSPSKSRREAEISYSVDMKPAGHVDRAKTTIYLGKDESGKPIAQPWLPNQQALPGVEDAFDLREDANADTSDTASDVH